MTATPTGLGKGLDALIRETSEVREPVGVQTVLLKDITPNPNQPRREFSEKSLEELAASIRSQGILQPLLLRPCGPSKPGKYEIVAGERRWRASQLAGLTEVPVLVRSFSAQDTLVAALIENLQREDLNPIEEALGIQTLKEEFDLSQDDLAQKIGKSRSAIANSLRLLSLPESIQNDLEEGRLSAGHARSLLSITEKQAQERLKTLILERHLSVREAEGLAAIWKATGVFESLADLSAEHGGNPANPADPDPSPGKQDAARKAVPQSARLLDIQTTISKALNTAVRVTGKEHKGRISLSYNSKEELDALLQRLSGNVLDGISFPALEGAQHPALERRQHPPLSGSIHESLEGSAHPALAAHSNPPLPGAELASLEAAQHPVLPASEHAVLDSQKLQALQSSRNVALDGPASLRALDSSTGGAE